MSDHDKELERTANRDAFPETAKIVDEFRRVFGLEVRLIWAEENGRQIGKKTHDSQRAS